MALRVLTWNLMHGRAVPGAGRDLLPEFAAALAGWEWDLALLQEVPPWWPPALAAAAGAAGGMGGPGGSDGAAAHAVVLTSRNALLPVRRALATRRPDVVKSNGGGANAILARPGAGRITERRSLLLRRWPERRRLHAVRLEPSGLWAGNLHLSVRRDAAARAEAARAAATLRAWAGEDGTAILGGDFNVRELALDGFALAGRSDVDAVFVGGGLRASPHAATLDRGRLSDHAPLLCEVELQR